MTRVNDSFTYLALPKQRTIYVDSFWLIGNV